MPIYEFQCQACGTEIEVLQKINDPHPTECEACGKSEMKKKVTAAAFRLSGAGWYETDFKEGDKKKNLTETADAKSTDAKKDRKGTETSVKADTTKSTKEDSSKSTSSSSDNSKSETKTKAKESPKPSSD